MGGTYIKYPNIYLAYAELWSADGIHLSNVGNERFENKNAPTRTLILTFRHKHTFPGI
jgi:hypothetical protein